MNKKISTLFQLFFLLLITGCSLQKRHYTKGFYVEKKNSVQAKVNAKNSFSEKIQISGQISSERPDPVTLNEPLALALVKPEVSKHETVSVHKKYKLTTILKSQAIQKTTGVEEEPDPNLNHTAKASVRLAIYSLLFFAGAMYVFFMLPGNFYIVLSLLIITFIFALITFLTSVHARKDRIATNRKGRNISRFATVLSLMILAAIALFLIFTPINI